MLRFIILVLFVCCSAKDIFSRDVRYDRNRDPIGILSHGVRSILNAGEKFMFNSGEGNDVWDFRTRDPDEKRNVSQLISSKGYPVESHDIQTKDGYVITVQRIPHGKTSAPYKGVVLMMSGLLGSSDNLVWNLENQSMGFIFADAGYDVWLGNVRGNTYGRKNVHISPRERAFWDFSFQDMGEKDLPALIDYILAHTSEEQLYYIGVSQGTSMAFALLSESPEYNQKIKAFAALGPVATLTHAEAPIRYLVPLIPDLPLLYELIGKYEFAPSNEFMQWLGSLICQSPLEMVCDELLFLFDGQEPTELNRTRIGVYITHAPAGTSIKNMIYWGQLVQAKKFQKFDYGEEGNQARYHQATPPEYCIECITAPVGLFWSLSDLLATPFDVAMLEPRLKSLALSYQIKDPYFTHGDLLIGIYAKKFVYDEVLSLFSKF